MTKYDVVALGEILVDMAPGEISAQGNSTFEACPGGAPCNVLSLLTKANHKTAFIGKVGDDMFGNMLINTIKELGIGTEGVVYDKEVRTTLAFVQKLPNGDRDFSFYRNPGADMMLNEKEVNYDLIKNTRIFHFGTLSMTSECAKEATQKAVKFAKDNGILVSFDPNLREPLWDDLEEAKKAILWGMENCDILKISDNEVEFMTGLSDMTEGYKKIKEMSSAKQVFVTLGGDGSMGSCGDEIIKVPGIKMESVVDTTGAGDTFMGCALHYILQNGIDLDKENIQSLLKLANSTAAKITQVKGALKVMPIIE
ncbi:MAG: carbohydrate kinase [Pseudobutyrivibrio sp.]|nr:carbohydrate kinase [Pseudobutyrivibrio sp.]